MSTEEEEQDRSQMSMDFEAYWRTLVQSKSPPSYGAFDPLEIIELVPDLTILKVTGSPEIKMLLVMYGTGLRDRTQYEATGDDVTDFFAPEDRAPYMKRLQAIQAQPCGIYQFIDITYANCSNVTSETTSLPLIGKSPDELFVVSLSHRSETSVVGADPELTHVNSSNRFTFLDVGFGVPAKSEFEARS